MRRAAERVLVFAVVLLSLALAFFPLPVRPVAADPWIVNNPDGTSDAVWNFTTPSDYALSNTAIAGDTVSLLPQVAWWNITTAADFAGPDSATNVDWARWPGDVAMATSGGPSTLLTLQPDAAGEDSWLDRGNPALNHGADATMILDGRNPQSRPVLRFDLSSIPAGVVIDNVTLSLYQSAGIGQTFTGIVYEITSAWNEMQVTWDNRLTGIPWGIAGGDFSTHVIDQRTLDNTVGWRTWNITQLVDLWYRGSLPNNGLILYTPNLGGADSDKTFYASDYNVIPALRPKLDIWYRVLGATGEYISKVGGPGTAANWQTVSWNATDRSLVTDEFDGMSLDPKWTWVTPPASYDVGTTTPGSLHVVSSTGVDLDGATFTGNVLTDSVAGDFIATMKLSTDPTLNGQKAGLMVLLNSRNWYAVQKTYVAATTSVNWQVKRTADAASVVPVDVPSGNPIPAWLRIARAGATFTASTSPDGSVWTLRDTYTPAFEYPLEVRIAFFIADGGSGTSLTADVDSLRVTWGNDATVTVQTRTGNTSPVDGTWSGWSAAYPMSAGSVMVGTSGYIEFRLSLGVTYPDHTPDVGDVNISWANYVASGTVETGDLVPADISEWGDFTVVQVLNGETITYAYSTDSGGSWTPVSPPASLQAVSIATGKIRFRATLSTSDTVVTPTLSEVRLTYRHRLDHFYVTGSASAAAGASFSVTVTAKDASNATITGWTGTVGLDARLTDGVTPGGGVLGTTSLTITTGGAATLATETYTKAETIRIHASFATAEGLSDDMVVSPGSLDHIVVTPNDVTLLPFDTQVFSGAGFDAWNNSVSGLSLTWSVTGGVGTLNASSGASVTFTASPPAANGTIRAAFGAVVGVAQIHVVNGARPWVAITSPSSGARLTGVVTIRYTNSSDAVSMTFEYDAGAGWTNIGATATLNGTYLWDASTLNFAGGSLRATVQNAALLTNTTVVSPVEVDNTPPTITLGTVTDGQATSGTLTLAYTTSADAVRIDFSYFDGTWHPIGPDLSITGSYVWTPGTPANGVTVRAIATDEVGLTGSDQRMGVGTLVVGSNPPSIQGIPSLQVHLGTAYILNLTFYVSDSDTARSSLSVWDSDAANVTASAGTYPSLSIAYAAAGTYLVTLWVSDGTDTAWTIITIVVSGANPPSQVLALPGVTFDEDTTATNAFGTPLSTYFRDLDGDPLTYAIIGSMNISSRVNGDGTVDLWATADWNGQEILRVHASDPSNGFAEAGFRVTIRAVDDAPVLAAVPAITIDAGSMYELNLTSFVTDVDNLLSDLVVTTDSPYVSVSGLVLTLAFPSDWTQATFTITVSDGVRTATQAVQVTIVPSALPWWRSVYVLAAPPIGVIVVVAMFAQRARWRPAKAFLVDERDRLLREFTLDPSCQVTYDQVREAGALQAVEKAIRVSKYHAQTVRGEALAVVMLAYGPVRLEQVEFAREMLVNIQDKFDVGVKQRLEDARTYEAELDAAWQSLEDSRKAFEVQSRTFAGMIDAITTAQSKMAAESVAIRARVLDLKQREALLQADRSTLDDFARQLEEQRAAIDTRATEMQELEADYSARFESLQGREARIEPLEAKFAKRDRELTEREEALRAQAEELAREGQEVQAATQSVAERQAAVGHERATLEEARAKFEADQKDLLKFRATLDARVAEVEKAERQGAERKQSLDEREGRLGPIESDLQTRDTLLKQAEERVRGGAERATALHLEAENLRKSVEEREGVLARDLALVEDTRRALGDQGKEFETRIARFEEESRRRKADLDAQAKALGDRQLQLAKEKESLDAMRTEKGQWIASKEIELEAREQTLQEKEAAVRGQAEENARRLAELAAREETLEIEGDKVDKGRAELDARKAELDKVAKSLDAKTGQLREEEIRKAEEYRTWQATLESEQALLKDQKETFEKETSELRESWALRMMRLQQREEEVAEREQKIRADVEWVARNEEDLKRREKIAEDAMKATSQAKVEVEAAREDIAQQALELETRERSLREEAARHADELSSRERAIRVAETEIAEKRAQTEREMTARGLKLQEAEAELSRKVQSIDSKNAELSGKEARLGSLEKSIREDEQRLARERTDLQAMAQQLEARQVELAQTRQRNEEEAARLRAEADAFRESTAAKEADLRSERERLERDSTSLQAKLGAKAEELAAREKALSAREDELRSEEQDLDSRLREVESRERQAQAHTAELNAQAAALAKRQQDMDARAAHLEETSKRLVREDADKRKEWENLGSSLKTQEAQTAAELSRRMAELESREKASAANQAQLEVERAKLADSAKAQVMKDADAAAAWNRSEKRFAELKAMEAEVLRSHQAFEAERAAWATKRSEELKQLEATRDAAGEQTQQAERLIEEAQRRAYVASETEKSAKRQADELTAFLKQVEMRRAEVEKAEKVHETHMAQLNEASRKIAANEMALAARTKDLDAREAKLAVSSAESTRGMEELKVRRADVDHENTRLAKLAADVEARRADADARIAAAESKKADLLQREQVLTTELQRAENLMEDLNRKEAEVKTREKSLSSFEGEVAKREAALAAKDAQLREGMQALEKMRQDLESKMARIDTDAAATVAARDEAMALKAEAEKAKAQADEMQKEVSKNMKFLQKKAVDVLDREEKNRERELKVEGDEKSLWARAEILEQKEKALEAEREDMITKMERMRADGDKLRAKLTEAEKAAKPAVDMEDWKKDIENRVKIIQKKAMELLDREEKMRQKEEELRALAQQLGVQF